MKHRLFSGLFLALAAGCASPEVREVAETPRDPRFEWFRGLSGDWVATEDSSVPGMRVEYRLTAGENVVQETLFPGTQHEMVTMIHPDGEGLSMTHYCALGNQPHMRAEPDLGLESVQQVDFRCKGGANMREDDAHMHRAIYTFLGEDHVQSAWTVAEAGEMLEIKRFDLIRSQSR